jgi:acetolactate synthase I/III small subunit
MTDTSLTVYYQQRPGAFDRITALLRRRSFPITGMTPARTHVTDIARLTVAVSAPDAVEQVRRHLQRLPDVIDVQVHGEGVCVQREYALIRVHRDEAVPVALRGHDARMVADNADEMVIEASGSREAVDALFAALEPFGIEESARTAPITLSYAEAGDTRRSA